MLISLLRKFLNFSETRKGCIILSKKFAAEKNNSLPKVIVLGSGWGSYSFLKNINKKIYEVNVVTPRNHFLFTPLLCSTTVGTLEFRSITEPIRNIGFRHPDDLRLAYATSLDISKKTLTCQSALDKNLTYDLNYDKLVIGVGALNNTFGIPGVKEHAFFLKEIHHARAIRNRILSNCESALEPYLANEKVGRLLHTVIVGGGPTGVEFGAELYDFKVKDVRRLYKHSEELFKVTLIESKQILSNFDKSLQAYAEKKLQERPNFHLVKSSVVEIKEDSVVLQDGTIIPCGLVVWSTGLSPQQFTKSLDVPKNKFGQIFTDSFLRVLGDPNEDVYALGDCAEIESLPLPCTAQVAERKGRYLANCFNNKKSKDETKPFHFKNLGMLAYIGDYKALTDLPEFKIQGFTSWFLWRSAYLTRLGSWRLRMQVPIDWLKTLIFGRDTSRF